MSSHTIIDRTLNGKRSSGNRQKFVKRIKDKIKDQLRKQVADGNIEDLVNSKGRTVTVPKKDLEQPTFSHGDGGQKDLIHPGNKEFVEGDRIPRPPKGKGQGGGASDKDDGSEDSFRFGLTHEEFLDMFFEDCELPDLRDTVIAKTDKFKQKRAGFSTDGPAALLNIERTMRTSKGRRIGLQRKGKKKRLEELEEKELELLGSLAVAEKEKNKKRITVLKGQITKIRKELVIIRRKLRAVPFIDDVDLRYNRWEKVPIPESQAVMFNLMDVSGSMGQWEKEMAKRFFMMLYLFLYRNYERVDTVWIRHTTVAKEVSEKEFFESRETGGTFVSTGLTLQTEIMKERYSPDEWNIYTCQASDGDNWAEDNHLAVDCLQNDILPFIRYMAYIEVNSRQGESSGTKRSDSDLWPHYETIAKQYEHFQMRHVSDAGEIYPVFKELFRKR